MSGGDTIRVLAEQMLAAGDYNNARKLNQLLHKWEAGRLDVAFCGHFSAGKSSLINRLCGKALLPSSPIPTSANLVTIRSGESEARVYRTGSDEPVSVPLDDLEAYCKNGEEIEAVEIRHPLPLLGDRATLLDTPGIDSTDDAHRLATESALHLADVIFYVMDYNHVQSELNFAFTKKLQDWGKPLYLIVNQIDKHRENELQFEDYRKSVSDSFAHWHIRPEGILFLSLKHPEHPNNEWDKLLWLFHGLLKQADALNRRSVADSAEQLIEAHADWQEAKGAEQRAELAREAEEMADREEALAEADRLESRLAALTGLSTEKRETWRQEAVSIIENANLTPAPTRDLAEHYLQSRKPGFKVGFFGRAEKTAKEIETRLEAFHADFASKVQAGLSWHLKDLFRRLAEEYRLQDELPAEALAELDQSVTPEWLASQVNTSAGFTGEYTLTYSRQIAAEAKSRFRQAALRLIDTLLELLERRWAAEAAETERSLAALRQRLASLYELQRLEHEAAAYRERLLAEARAGLAAPAAALPDWRSYAPPARDGDGAPEAAAALAEAPAAPAAGALAARAAAAAGAREAAGQPAGGASAQAQRQRQRLGKAAGALRQAAELLAELPPMASAVRAMRDKASRMETNRFTIALFGAFSAGKSSLANALVGERLLPVSPNPTTAAINTILPATNEHPHGTVIVRMKRSDAMLDEVRHSLQVLGFSAGGWEDSLRTIAGLAPSQVNEGGKPHFTFLKAVERGWAEANGNLGQELTVGFEAFAAYVADESKSCFVEAIALHAANPLTDQGMVLVDTPGADSINARHTGVAFNYIKNADAILFVTYYNHAFSQADREFLLQLGRVKEAFELDKMFFLVNAADLAADEAELDAVVHHVEENLARHGVRQPRIYPVSSMLALEGKERGDDGLVEQSGIAEFERQFIRFSMEELTGIAVQSAAGEVNRAAGMLAEWIANARKGEEEKRRSLAELEKRFGEASRLLAKAELTDLLGQLDKEAEELVYYIRQRLSYRFGDFFALSFHPGALREDQGDIRSALRSSWHELVRYLSYDASQEVLATTLRLEQTLTKEARKRRGQLWHKTSALLPGYPEPETETLAFETPEVAETVAAEEPESRWLTRFYKNSKFFFEEGGRTKLREELEGRLLADVGRYLDEQLALLKNAYRIQAEERMAQLLEQDMGTLREHYEGIRASLDQHVDVKQLESLHANLMRLDV
ncbi:hypothetical protein J31TS4_06830 [Paenibacillus sp. J31TS4]|uniref:dynamin family protein n=1 Tax=Paenibacillus sp. J31TS4 TaxID=2807195 RepID=UPI001B071D07|nr:dynamin family protein [Paenibacillus sp. J31TS4]GIP37403.1 hypothetical protein J31TS4_06830 [Paenibacillus sp. J31TS4]